MLNGVVRWVPAYPDDPVVWVDVSKIDAGWRRDEGFYVRPGGSGPQLVSPGRYTGFGAWLRDSREPVEMPHLGPWRNIISFSNGRRRFAWCRDHGVTALPVTTDPALRGRLCREFGTPKRVSRLAVIWGQEKPMARWR